jgi:hypothetical protein
MSARRTRRAVPEPPARAEDLAPLETNPLLTLNPHGLLIDNVFIGATDADSPNYGAWGYGVYLDGSLNANPPAGVPAGIRYVRLRNVSVSRYTILPYLAYYAYATSMVQVDCYIPLGGASTDVWALHSANTFVLSTTSVEHRRDRAGLERVGILV